MRKGNHLIRLWNRGWPFLLLALLVVVFFWRSILFGEVLVPADLLGERFPWKPYFPPDFLAHNVFASDVIDSQYPARAVARQAIHSGQLPLWDPYTSAGKPLGTMPIYPLSLPLNVLLWLLPLDVGFTLVTAVRLFISAVGMFAFLRELKLGKMSALVGSIIFTFNGFVMVWLNATAGTTLSLAPLVFWAGERAIRKASKKNLCLLALTVGLLVSGGFLAVVLYVLYALTGYLVFRAGQTAWRQSREREALQKLVSAGLAVALGLALMAPQLASFWDHLQLTNYNEFRTREQVGLASEPLYNAILYLIPDYYGKLATRDWFGTYPEHTGYVGILPLILASLALLSPRQKGVIWFFAGLGLVAIGTVYGAPINQLVAGLPGLMMAPAIRLKSIFALSTAVLAAFGLDALQRSCKRNGWKIMTSAIITAGGMLAVFSLVERYWATAVVPVPQHFDRTLLQLWQTGKFSHYLFDNLLLWSLWLLSSLVLVLARVKRLLSPRMLGMGATLLICADLVGWGMGYNQPVKRSFVFPQTPGITFLQNQTGFFRMTGVGGSFFPNMPSVYQIQDIVGHDPLAPDRYRAYLRAIDSGATFGPGTVLLLRSKTANLNSPLLDLWNLRYLVFSPQGKVAKQGLNEQGFSLVYQGPDMIVYENEDALPRCYVVNQVQTVPDAETLLSRLAQARVAPSDTVFLEESPPESFYPTTPGERGQPSAEILAYTANRVRVRATTAAPGFLVLADMHYPGWQASADNQQTRIYRANYLFRAVYLEPGDHVVEFVFRPRPYLLGQIVRLAALLAMVIAAAWERGRRAWAARSGAVRSGDGAR